MRIKKYESWIMLCSKRGLLIRKFRLYYCKFTDEETIYYVKQMIIEKILIKRRS